MLKNSITKVLFCIVFCLLIGCKEEKQIVSFVHFERKADTIQLDLSLSNKNLIKFLEKEKQINFCDNKFRIGTFDLDNKVCFFPIIIGKYCDTDPLNHNIVDIETNQDHQILVESELVQNDKGLKKEILKHSIERFNAKNYKGLFYNLGNQLNGLIQKN